MSTDFLSYEKLHIWQKSIDWAVDVIDLVDGLNTGRKHFRLIEQLEAASSSVSMNIAEGKGRWSKKEFRQYLFISRGSLYETLTILLIFRKKAWIIEKDYQKVRNKGLEINKMLKGLIYKMNQSINLKSNNKS